MIQRLDFPLSPNLQKAELAEDIIGWDVVNWLQALNYWESKVTLGKEDYRIAEVGCAFGGLSLWFALRRIQSTLF